MKIEYSSIRDCDNRTSTMFAKCIVNGKQYVGKQEYNPLVYPNLDLARYGAREQLYKQIIEVKFETDQDSTITGIGYCNIDGVEYKQYINATHADHDEIAKRLVDIIVSQIEDNDNNDVVKFVEKPRGDGSDYYEVTGIAIVDGIQFKDSMSFQKDLLEWRGKVVREYAHEVISKEINKQINNERSKYGEVKFEVKNNKIKAYVNRSGIERSVQETIYYFPGFDMNTIIRYIKLSLCEKLKS